MATITELEALEKTVVRSETDRLAESPTIDGVPFVPMAYDDPDCESAVGCEFGCRCKGGTDEIVSETDMDFTLPRRAKYGR